MKLSDTAVKNPSSLKWNPLNKRYAPKGGSKSATTTTTTTTDADAEGEEEDEEIEGGGEDDNHGPEPSDSMTVNEKISTSTSAPPLPAKENPLIIAMYGQICIAAKSYQSAICM